jgi:hypothetical protein
MNRIRLNVTGGQEANPTPVGKVAMPSIAPPVHVASMVPQGGMHSYLQHFAQPKFLRAGHNTCSLKGMKDGSEKV